MVEDFESCFGCPASQFFNLFMHPFPFNVRVEEARSGSPGVLELDNDTDPVVEVLRQVSVTESLFYERLPCFGYTRIFCTECEFHDVNESRSCMSVFINRQVMLFCQVKFAYHRVLWGCLSVVFDALGGYGHVASEVFGRQCVERDGEA